MADLGYKINVQLPDEPHPGVLIILSGNETVKALLMAINKKVRKLFKRGYKCQYVTNKEGSVLDPEFTLLSALEREDTVAAHQHKLKTLGEVVGAKGSKKRTAQAAGIKSDSPAPAAAAVHDSSAAGGNDSSDDEDSSSDDDDDFQDKEATAAKKVAVVTPGPKPAPPPAATPEPSAKKIKKEKKVRDPNMPKRAPNHFMLFMEKNRTLIVGEGFTGKHVMSEASKRWAELPPSEKTPFTESAKQLKDVYDASMVAYKAGKEGDGTGSGAAVLVAAARAAAAAAESASPQSAAVSAPPPPEPEPEPTPQSAPPSAPSTPAVTTRKAKSAKSKCDYTVLKRVLKQNAGTAVPEFLGAVLAGYNTAKAEAKSSSWLVTKMTGDKMTGFVSSQLSAAHRAAIQK